MIPTLNNATSSTQQSTATQPASTQSSSAAGLDPLASEQTFLQLLVAQLKNQDPENPQDGTQFVTELAQFSSVEQQVQMRTDLDSINTLLTAQANQQANSGPHHFRPPYPRFPPIAQRSLSSVTTWRI